MMQELQTKWPRSWDSLVSAQRKSDHCQTFVNAFRSKEITTSLNIMINLKKLEMYKHETVLIPVFSEESELEACVCVSFFIFPSFVF